MFKKAFTLAEVLIVIAIIGTVATLTIPNLANQYQDDKTAIKIRQVKNDLDLALHQALQKYGEYGYWYSSFTTANKEDAVERIVEFLEVQNDNATFPVASYNNDSEYYKYELSDGVKLAIKFGSNGICGGNGCNYMQVIVATGGPRDVQEGKYIFGFTINPYDGIVSPYGKGADYDGTMFSVANYINGTNWAISIGNLDYLKCAGSLDWKTKTSCD